MKFEHIVISTGLSEAHAALSARSLAFARGVGCERVTVVHVHDAGTGALSAEDSATLEATRERFEAAGIRASVRVLEGKQPGRVLLGLTDDIDLFAVARVRQESDPGGRMGSVVRRLLSSSVVPTLVVPSTAKPAAAPIQQVGLTFDFSQDSRHGLRPAMALCERLGARLTLFHVARSPAGWESLQHTPDPLFRTRATTRVRQDCEKKLAELLPKVSNAARPTCKIGIGGDVPGQLVAMLEAERVGLALIPSHGKGALRTLLLGSMTAEVVARASMPVLVLPPVFLETAQEG